MKKKINEEALIQQRINQRFLIAVDRLETIDSRLSNLIRYSEYLAHSLDLTINYIEFVDDILAKDRKPLKIGEFEVPQSEHIPTFLEYVAKIEREAENEIPF